ncbi:hypothetical protein QJQ45_016481 [Haematococcus lacustris]|nr:hypothetical protein QJQ45_016481 [Haematococcus lacustris]
MFSSSNGLLASLALKAKAMAQGVSEAEMKVFEATNEDKWGPHGNDMKEIARLADDYERGQLVMNAIWQRLQEQDENWRLCYKALLLCDYLIRQGPMRCVDEFCRNITVFERLRDDFAYKDQDGRDQGVNVRQRARDVAALLSDPSRIQVERAKARSNAGKYIGVSAADMTRGGGAYGGSSSARSHHTPSSSGYDSPSSVSGRGGGSHLQDQAYSGSQGLAGSAFAAEASVKPGHQRTMSLGMLAIGHASSLGSLAGREGGSAGGGGVEDPFEATRRRIERLKQQTSTPNSPALATHMDASFEGGAPLTGGINMDASPNLFPDNSKVRPGPKRLSEVKVNPAIAAAFGGLAITPDASTARAPKVPLPPPPLPTPSHTEPVPQPVQQSSHPIIDLLDALPPSAAPALQPQPAAAAAAAAQPQVEWDAFAEAPCPATPAPAAYSAVAPPLGPATGAPRPAAAIPVPSTQPAVDPFDALLGGLVPGPATAFDPFAQLPNNGHSAAVDLFADPFAPPPAAVGKPAASGPQLPATRGGSTWLHNCQQVGHTPRLACLTMLLLTNLAYGCIPADARVELDEDSTLPPFANDENRALDAAIRALEKQLERADAAHDENKDRINIMMEHLANVQQELKYTQSRVESKVKEIETEQHLKQLAERETGRLRADTTRLVNERGELGDKVSSLKTQVFKANEKLDGFKLLMNWNQEELEQWALAQKQKEEDNAALEKYRHQDAAKVKELQLALDKMSRAVVAKKEELEGEVLETQAAQIQLDKAAEDFRKLHTERQELIRQWDDAMEAMRNRDNAIVVATEQFAQRKAELKQRKAELDAQAKFLEAEAMNNKEVDARIAFYDREVAKQRDVYLREQQRLADLDNEVEAVKATLNKAANELAGKGAENEGARQELDAKRQRLDASRKKYALLRRQLEGEFAALDSLEGKVAELEVLRKADEGRLKAVIKEAEDLKKEQFKRSQRLFDLRGKERTLISEISGGQGQNKNLAARISGLDQQVVRQQELLYNVEFQLQQMERKVARAGGVRSEEESRALHARIEKLTAVLEGVNAEHSMLLDQVKHSEEDLLKARRVNVAFSADKAKIDEVLGTLKLENEMVGRQVKLVVTEKEKTMVDHDVMKLVRGQMSCLLLFKSLLPQSCLTSLPCLSPLLPQEVKRLRDILALHADEVFSLENRKFQLKMSAEERRQEVEVHRDGLRTELKLLRDDIHRITLELRERALKVEKLQSKFEVISTKTRGADDEEGGEPKSQAYYVIKAAQEREELQREGDELDARIRRAEKEVAALEATLLQLVGANGKLGASYRKVEGGTAHTERAQLREKLDRVYDKLKYKRQEETLLAADCSQLGAQLNNLADQQRQLTAGLDNLGRRKTEAERAVSEQSEKLQRARRATQRAAQTLRVAPGDASHPASKEVTLAEMREVTKAMLTELASLASQYPEAGLAALAAEVGVRLPGSGSGSTPPSTAGSRAGSRPTSARSSISVGNGRQR